MLGNDHGTLAQLLAHNDHTYLLTDAFFQPLMVLVALTTDKRCWREWKSHGYTSDNIVSQGATPRRLFEVACDSLDIFRLQALLKMGMLRLGQCLNHGLRSADPVRFDFWAQAWENAGTAQGAAMSTSMPMAAREVCHASEQTGAKEETKRRARDLAARWIRVRAGAAPLETLWQTWIGKPPELPEERAQWLQPVLRELQRQCPAPPMAPCLVYGTGRLWASALVATGIVEVDEVFCEDFIATLGVGMTAAQKSHDHLWRHMRQVIQRDQPARYIQLPEALRGEHPLSQLAGRLGMMQAEACRQAMLMEFHTAAVPANNVSRVLARL